MDVGGSTKTNCGRESPPRKRKHSRERDRSRDRSTSKKQQDTKGAKDESQSPKRSSRHRNRSRSRDRHSRSDSGQDRRRHRRSRSRSRSKNSYDREERHSRGSRRERISRSRSSERNERKRERNKLEMRQLMAKNYEERSKTLKQTSFREPIDPAKLVEQVEQRKLLWSKKEKPVDAPAASSASAWKQPKFNDDCDGKVSAKFKRLMGMKDGETAASSRDAPTTDTLRQRDEYFDELEKQYEVARVTTHTQRGLGLGFSTRSYVFPKSK